jgi:hypothetical protein
MVQYQDKFRDQYSQDTKSNAQLSSKKSQCMNIRSAPNNISFSNAPKPTQRDPSQLTGILATLTMEIQLQPSYIIYYKVSVPVPSAINVAFQAGPSAPAVYATVIS